MSFLGGFMNAYGISCLVVTLFCYILAICNKEQITPLSIPGDIKTRIIFLFLCKCYHTLNTQPKQNETTLKYSINACQRIFHNKSWNILFVEDFPECVYFIKNF